MVTTTNTHRIAIVNNEYVPAVGNSVNTEVPYYPRQLILASILSAFSISFDRTTGEIVSHHKGEIHRIELVDLWLGRC